MKNFLKWLFLILAIVAVAGVFAWAVTQLMPDTPEPSDPPFEEDGYSVAFDDSENGILEVTLPASGEVRFNVSGTKSYTVEVVSNINDKDGSVLLNYYTINGSVCIFAADDYTDDFMLNEYEGYFIIACEPGYYDLETLLCRKHGVGDISFYRPVTDEYIYKMIITSAEGEEFIVLLNQA